MFERIGGLVLCSVLRHFGGFSSTFSLLVYFPACVHYGLCILWALFRRRMKDEVRNKLSPLTSSKR